MNQKNLIIFFVPPKKIINGGVMSIFSQCKEARRFYNLHHSESIICTYPGNETYDKNDLFDNNEKVYSFDQVIKKWKKPKKIIFHIPETAVTVINNSLREKYSDYLKSVDDLHINVMTQNIELIKSPSEFAELFNITPNITQTTAHKRYTTQELSNRYQTPVHHLSVFIDQSQYKKIPYDKKENLIIYSPDDNPYRKKVLSEIKSLKKYKLVEIRDMPYEKYKNLAEKAKFCITFREGFDGYFIEGFFSGGIGISVYNDEFFPDKNFLNMPSVFRTYDSMVENIVPTIQKLDRKKTFDKASVEGQRKIGEIYNYNYYLGKIESFYEESYDIIPQLNSTSEIIIDILEARDQHIHELTEHYEEKHKEIVEKFEERFEKEHQRSEKLKRELNSVLGSKSWKLTEPLRNLNKIKFLKKD